MKKRFAWLAAVLFIALSLSACGGTAVSRTSTKPASPSKAALTETEGKTEPTETAKPEEIAAPEETAAIDASPEQTEEPNTEETEETSSGDPSQKTDSSPGLSSEFKASMDSYEAFMDEYIAFMEKVEEDPGNLELLMSYATYMGKYAECVESFEAWEEKDLNSAELSYYMGVQLRVSQKLLKAAQ